MRGESVFRLHSRDLCRTILTRIAREVPEKELARSAVVFSPHYDDETLGCGGTIIKKKIFEADVKLVFMTDGCRSHKGLISEDELRAIRASEGLAAARTLGIEEGDVIALDFEEGKLARLEKDAVKAVLDVLLRYRPEEVFIPYRSESLSDHSATNRIVMSAIQIYGKKTLIYEYPIWFWHNWPWVDQPLPWMRQPPSGFRQRLIALRSNIASVWNLLNDFRCSVYIGDVLGRKREALDQHKSQMTRLVSDPQWATLNDVANGDFLKCFFQPHEIFSRQTFHSES